MIIEGAVALLYILLSYRTLNNQLSGTPATQGTYLWIMLLATALWAGASFLIYKLCQRGLGIVRIFLCIYAMLGVLFFVAVPLYGTPDELAHYERIYGITEGRIIADVAESGEGGSLLPANIVEGNYDRDTTLSSNRNGFSIVASEEEAFITYGNTAYYSPLTYMPQIIGVRLARFFSDKLYIAAYAGRIFGFITVGLMLARAIHLLPFGREIVFVIGLFPITVQEAVSLSGDAFTLAVATYFTAYAVHAMCDSGGLSKGEIAEGFLLLLFLGGCKFIYVPLAILLLIVPADRFGGRQKKIIMGIVALLMLAAECFGWLAVTGRYMDYAFREGVNVIAQREVILAQPLQFLGIYAATLGENLSYLLTGMTASHLGIYNVEPPIWISRLGLIALLAAAFVSWEKDWGKKQTASSKKASLKPAQIICMLLVTILIAILIGISLYLQWTPVGAQRIEGIQGRYFLPILPAFMLAVTNLLHLIPATLSMRRDILYRTSLFVAMVAWVCLFSYYLF